MSKKRPNAVLVPDAGPYPDNKLYPAGYLVKFEYKKDDGFWGRKSAHYQARRVGAHQDVEAKFHRDHQPRSNYRVLSVSGGY